jgi:integrase
MLTSQKLWIKQRIESDRKIIRGSRGLNFPILLLWLAISGNIITNDARFRNDFSDFDHRNFDLIKKKAGVKKGTFHDLRRTAICNWLSQGMTEYDVMKLARRSCFDTTHRFYLAIKNDYLDKARRANVG